jgi:hypothetical protein
MKSILLILTTAFAVICHILAQPAAAGVLYVSLTDRDFNGVAMFTDNLGLIDQIEVAGPPSSIAAGPDGTFYLGSGNTIRQYDDAGNVLNSLSGTPTTTVPTMDFGANNQVYVGLQDGTFDGFARFTSNAGLLDQEAVGIEMSALAAGLNDTLYIGGGRTVQQIDHAGNVLGTVSGSPTTEIIDISFSGDIVFVALQDRDFFGVALFTSGLGLLDQVEIFSGIDAIAAGPSDGFYLANDRHLLHYDLTGNILRSIQGSPTTMFTDLDFRFDVVVAPDDDPVEVAEPAATTVLGLSLLLLVRLRRASRA